MRTSALSLALASSLVLLGPARAEAPRPAPPLTELDRMRMVGRPVLDPSAEEGVHVWLEDGWYHLAAVTELPFGTKKKETRTFRVRLVSTEPVEEALGGFEKTSDTPRWLELVVHAGPEPVEGRFRTEGTITIFKAEYGDGRPAPIFLGPLSKRAAPGVRVGRF